MLLGLVVGTFIFYKQSVSPYYHVSLGGGDWGLLVVFIIGWPVWLITQLPLLIIASILIKKSTNYKDKIIGKLTLSVTLLNLFILLMMTTTGRLIFQPIYEIKHRLIQSLVSFEKGNLKVNEDGLYGEGVILNKSPIRISAQIETVGTAPPNACMLNNGIFSIGVDPYDITTISFKNCPGFDRYKTGNIFVLRVQEHNNEGINAYIPIDF